jgi:hypothetical protein
MANYDIHIDRCAGVRGGDRLMRVQIGGALLRWCLEHPSGDAGISAPPDIGVVGALGLLPVDTGTPDWSSISDERDDQLITCFVADSAGTNTDPVPTLATIAAALTA